MKNNLTFTSADFSLRAALSGIPNAAARIQGGESAPQIFGLVRFYQTKSGVLVFAQINGLPSGKTDCSERIFGFHIHDGTECTGNAADEFANAGTHYNPNGCKHPHHAGDLPPLFGNDGLAVLIFLTSRFTVNDIIGKAIIIHDSPDDFMTDPTGNAGKKIACGIIKRTPQWM